MNSTGLQQNFILFVENKTKEAHKTLNGRLCCEKCRFSTKDAALFERHVAHHEEVTFSCTLCNHVSYSRVESQRHLVKHKGSFPYKCNWCPYGAVRRDYMVKHIQRIHGKSADGSFTTDYALSTTEMEYLSQKGTNGLCLTTPRTLSGPSHDVKVASHSAGNVSSLFSGVSQSRPSAPYLVTKTVQQPMRSQICSTTAQSVTSTTCSVPITKSQPYIVPNNTHTVCKVTQGIAYPPNVMVSEVGQNVGKAIEYIKRFTEKTSLEKTVTTSALPRVHVGISGDRTMQQKPLLQSQVAGTTERTAIQSKIIPKIHVGLPVGNNNHLKTILSNTLEGPAAQRPVISGVVQNIPVAHVVQRSILSGANPSIPAERFGQGAPTITPKAQTPGKASRRITRPNILVRPPSTNFESSRKSGVQVELLEPLNQPIQHNRPLTASGPEERNHPWSNVQVELLAPLNQPIQHNRPLTVSCPEEITIPAGCLVELVEVKNVNGTRELELRLVPQQLTGPQVGDLKSTTVTGTTGRLSFKCRVATDDNQPINMNHGINIPKANAIPENLIQGSHLKKLPTDIKVNVKNEPESNDKVLCSSKNETQAPGSSSKWLDAASRSIPSNPSESHKVMQLCTGHKNVANASEPVNPLRQMHCTGKNTSPSASNKNVTSEGLKYELRAAQPSPNKCKDAELSYQGLPVISSVFSLCPIPQDTLNQIHTRVGISDKQVEEGHISSDSGSNESVKITDNPRICRLALKTEDETRLFTENAEDVPKSGQLNEKKDEILKDTKASEAIVPEKIDGMLEKTIENDQEITQKLCRSSNDALQTDPLSSANISSASNSDLSTQHKKKEKSKLESEKILLAQRDSPLTLSMNPTVALVRMPSLEFFSLSESAKKVLEKTDGEESITARPVLCCTSNQQNLQERTIKLVLKRKRSETENKDLAQDPQLGLACIDIQPTHKKVKKEKKRAKKHKPSKVQQMLGKGTVGKMWLTPLKDDQLVKLPGPNQPVVVLNHPDPLVQMVSVEVQTLNNQNGINSFADLHNQNGTTLSKPVRQCPSFKMKLKKVQGQKYQVTELVLKGVSEKTNL